MGRGRPLPELKLTAEENNRLVEWTRRHKTSQALAMRARIVLACAQGAQNIEAAARLHVSKQMVGKWRRRFVERRLDGLLDDPRPGRPGASGMTWWKPSSPRRCSPSRWTQRTGARAPWPTT